MPFLQKHPDSFRRDVRSPPKLQFVSDLPQQIQSCVPMLPVLQLNAVVFSRHSDTGEPGEDTKKRKLLKLSKVSCLLVQNRFNQETQTNSKREHLKAPLNLKRKHSWVHPQLVFLCPSPHLLFNSSIFSVGTIMFPWWSMLWKDWKVFSCCGISSRQTFSNTQ